MEKYEFHYVEELGIEIPHLYVPYDELSEDEKEDLQVKFEEISGKIPERIQALEKEYRDSYYLFAKEPSEDAFYHGMEYLNRLSRNICELNILYLQMQGNHLVTYIAD
ncbi:hypothetical protein [Thermicanus aegyptius]|uniref:hypothetical protein n=1 Tax=Thermicanus aegyptius TaxID=94009 RepID=UPI00040A4D10|nr:hypothetical protein [Thermicanus aegyptius]